MRIFQNNNLFYIFFVVFFLSPLRIDAKSDVSNFNDFVRQALINNEGLQAAYQNWQSAMQRKPQTKSLPEPKLSYQRFIEKVQTRTGPQENILSLSQQIPLYGKLRLRGEIASSQAQAACHVYEAKRLKLIDELGQAYFNYAYIKKALVIEKQNIGLLKKLDPIVQEKVRGGGAVNSSLRLDIEIGKSKDAIQSLKNQKYGKSAVITALLGNENIFKKQLQKINLKDFSIKKVSLPDLQSQLLAFNPELATLSKKFETSQKKYKLSKKSPLPDPNISFSAIDIGDGGKTAFSVGVGFSIPLWFGKYRAERQEARAQKNAAEKTLCDMQKKLLAKLRVAWASLIENTNRISLYQKKLIPSARQAIEIAEKDYRSDKASILELIDTQRVLLDLEKRYWRAVANAHQSVIEIKTLTGKNY